VHYDVVLETVNFSEARSILELQERPS
jgi:hypothetical protein